MYDDEYTTANSVERWLQFYAWLNAKVQAMNENEIQDFSSAWAGFIVKEETHEGVEMRGVNDRLPEWYVRGWARQFSSLERDEGGEHRHTYSSHEDHEDPIVKAERRFQESAKARKAWHA